MPEPRLTLEAVEARSLFACLAISPISMRQLRLTVTRLSTSASSRHGANPCRFDANPKMSWPESLESNAHHSLRRRLPIARQWFIL